MITMTNKNHTNIQQSLEYKIANNKINDLIDTSKSLIEAGDYRKAFKQLETAYSKSQNSGKYTLKHNAEINISDLIKRIIEKTSDETHDSLDHTNHLDYGKRAIIFLMEKNLPDSKTEILIEQVNKIVESYIFEFTYEKNHNSTNLNSKEKKYKLQNLLDNAFKIYYATDNKRGMRKIAWMTIFENKNKMKGISQLGFAFTRNYRENMKKN
ncbi:TPA: hypothetical protein HA235_07870 [Candidatus Woesearchaeota archaeon]|nr:hypothetical protein [Candidatus Woesearchaeota archaeon]HIH32593.1 hypothetical protein [Candidatus Woesearchaeota archaeon]HIH54928.1 hypothetical protein [Candidatus Woesearchaeota archaeon]HIJ01041.1 hypothetical protein [Candidatus Woesearchaeota archaeon]